METTYDILQNIQVTCPKCGHSCSCLELTDHNYLTGTSFNGTCRSCGYRYMFKTSNVVVSNEMMRSYADLYEIQHSLPRAKSGSTPPTTNLTEPPNPVNKESSRELKELKADIFNPKFSVKLKQTDE